MFILIYGAYVGLICIWLILGAIINPNTFLVYATSAITFVTFVVAKYQEYKTLAEEGFKKVQELVQNVFSNQMKKIVGLMANEARSLAEPNDLAKFSMNKAKDFGMDEEINQYKSLIENQINNNEDPNNNSENIVEKMKEWEENMVFINYFLFILFYF